MVLLNPQRQKNRLPRNKNWCLQGVIIFKQEHLAHLISPASAAQHLYDGWLICTLFWKLSDHCHKQLIIIKKWSDIVKVCEWPKKKSRTFLWFVLRKLMLVILIKILELDIMFLRNSTCLLMSSMFMFFTVLIWLNVQFYKHCEFHLKHGEDWKERTKHILRMCQTIYDRPAMLRHSNVIYPPSILHLLV